MRILMVCSGNICRSPLAEVAATERFRDRADILVESAGSVAVTGQRATLLMRDVAIEHGLDLADHRATPLRNAAEPDLVFGMEQEHLLAARAAFPSLPVTGFRLLDHPRAVPDPYGYDVDVYRAAASQIIDAVGRIDVD